MVVDIIIKKSDKKDKKYDAIIEGKKTVSFGQANASDFTKHKDEERKENYINRHRKNEDWDNHETAGFYSRWITLGKAHLKRSSGKCK